MNKGSCLCNSVTFTVDAFEPLIGHCHCTMCQKFHGAAFSTFAEVKLHHFHLVSGEEVLSRYTANNQTVRSFCKVCGSSLFFESSFNQTAKTIEVALACFDNLSESVTPDAHIYTESKACWYEINDQLPQHKQYRTS